MRAKKFGGWMALSHNPSSKFTIPSPHPNSQKREAIGKLCDNINLALGSVWTGKCHHSSKHSGLVNLALFVNKTGNPISVKA